MKAAALLPILVLAGTSLSAPAASPEGDSSQPPHEPFVVKTVRYGSGGEYINFRNLIARNGRLWVGDESRAPCPMSTPQCGPSTTPRRQTFTVFTPIADHQLGFDVEIDGGQQIYAMPSGEVHYTRAGNATLPEGAIPGVFDRTSARDGSALITRFRDDYDGWLACPIDPAAKKPKYYVALWRKQDAAPPTGCIKFDAVLYNWWKPEEFAARFY